MLFHSNRFTFLRDESQELQVPFTLMNNQIYYEDSSSKEPFQVIGLNVVSALPGEFANEESLDESQYLEWLTLIQELGVTVLRLPDLMPRSFYEALLTFNESHEIPLYVLQGIAFDEVALNDGEDLQQLKESYIHKMKQIIDCLYGGVYPESEKLPLFSRGFDLSPYLLGYSLGMEWESDDLIFSEIMGEANPYSGTYFETTSDATSVESFLAELMDELVGYESTMYRTQHLVTMMGSNIEETLEFLMQPKTEALRGERVFKNIVDLNQIKPTNQLESGFFASYNLYPILSEQLKENVTVLLEQLQMTHDMPVVISEYGIPSAKVVYEEVSNPLQGINETQQAKALVNIYEVIKKSHLLGGFLSDWQDRWDRTVWTTVDEIILDRSPYWKNELTHLQSMGLYTFDASLSYPDNQLNDWKETKVFLENEQVQLSIKADEAGLFFLIQWKEALPVDASYFINLDVTPNSGSMTYEKEGLAFDRPVDFVIQIDSKNPSRVLVQRYYQTYEFLQNQTNLQIRPDNIEVTKDMDEFVPILIEVKQRTYDETKKQFIDAVVQEAGLLIEGDANPSSTTYNSLANYYKGEDYVEIKIPWGLLNFSDPSTNQIHDDYYEKFGISSYQISSIGVGLTIKSEEDELLSLPSKNYRLSSWMSPTYHPRLKSAYYELQKAFLNGEKGGTS